MHSTATGMAYERLANYLEWMKAKVLVCEEDSGVCFADKGMNSYTKLVGWVIVNVGETGILPEKP